MLVRWNHSTCSTAECVVMLRLVVNIINSQCTSYSTALNSKIGGGGGGGGWGCLNTGPQTLPGYRPAANA